MKPSILIVGAGPTGLTTAVELARLGIIADVIDKHESASGFSRAVGILPRSLQLLEASGVTEKLFEEGKIIRTARVFNSSGRVADITLKPARVKYGHDCVIGLAQDRTEAILRDVFEKFGGKVKYSCAFEAYSEVDGKLEVALSGGTKTYDIVIGADGIRSQVRQQMGVNYTGVDLPDVWSIADVDSKEWPHKECFCINLLPKGEVAIVVPIEKHRYRVISNTPNGLKSLIEPLIVSNIRREGTFKISVRQAETYQNGNVYLAGDAAHCHSPVGGRGMNAGIADACELARRIAENDLDEYTKVRHENCSAIIKQTERVRKIISSSNPVPMFLTRHVLPRLLALPFVQGRFSNVLLYGGDAD